MFLTYARVSTRGQSSPDKVSLDEQLLRCRAVAAMHKKTGYEVCEYVDRGVSGGTPISERPAGMSMLASASQGDVIVASKLDRIFRSASDALVSIETWRRQGIDLIICDIGLEPISASPSAKLFFGMLSLVAEFERERIHERITEGKTAKKARGGHVGGLTPLGFRKDGTGKDAVLLPDETERAHIRRARALQGTLRAIGDQMATEGMFGRDGKPYRETAIWRMLHKQQESLNG